jgi:hypothetical protein
LSRTVKLFVVFVVDLSMAQIITYTLIWISTISE